ncbi:hypothetical protein OPT61_g10061 [Boeremia exigua]|uniref:Uncharacterized protein n=1 Tax=Boeremia exigua TaxID=749465 RepID=A0ACC2HRL3_9PLEO|nr:hypothetical protein OPT61_g10061 [Boeremia exigua]
MSVSMPSFEYSSSLQQFAVPESDYLREHHDVDIICTGAVVFDSKGRLLLVQRAKEEKAYPDAWEIPGGKMDDTDETILHAAARELKEETGLTATRVVRKVTEFTFLDGGKSRPNTMWLKLIFEFEVEDPNAVVLDPVEHQRYLWASEDEVTDDLVKEGSTCLKYISPRNKEVKLEAFRLQREAVPA